MNTTKTSTQSPRSPGDSYEEILASDVVPSPDFYKEGPTPDIGTESVAASRYYDQAFLQQENDFVFTRVWQWVCREEDIPNIGDYVVYDIGSHSWVVVRSERAEFKALLNVCPHRGRQIVEQDGNSSRFRCPYHGLQWNLDGHVQHNPFGWDMPQWGGCGGNLPQAQVELWGGFVFINMDTNAPPLLDVLAPIPEHFERYDLAGKYKAAHVIKKMRANWKATCEAFMESHHVVGTHPQALSMTGDLNSQYDIWSDYVGRQFTAAGVQSPNIDRALSKEEILGVAAFNKPQTDQEINTAIPDDFSARAFTAESTRQTLKALHGQDYSDAGDAELIDSLLYHVFPNICFWAGVTQNIVYRFRPNGMDPDSSLMDILILRPCPADAAKPEPTPIRYLDFDDPVADVEEIGESLGEIYDQDADNLPWVQKGLRASRSDVSFCHYMEARLRRHHQMLDKFINEGRTTVDT